MNTDFMPNGFQQLKTEKKYLRLSQFQPGETKIRIVQKPIAGWIDWCDNKPFRFPPDKKPKSSFDPEKPMKVFWSLYIWDYSREGLYILEINQTGVIKALTAYGSDEDWGDFTTYDLKIKKEGSGMDTRYTVTALPHKDASETIRNALKIEPVNLEALYMGKDPWTDFDPLERELQASPAHFGIPDARDLLINAIDVPEADKFLPQYLAAINLEAPKQGMTLQRVVTEWLQNPPRFLDAYKKWCLKEAKKMSLQPV